MAANISEQTVSVGCFFLLYSFLFIVLKPSKQKHFLNVTINVNGIIYKSRRFSKAIYRQPLTEQSFTPKAHGLVFFRWIYLPQIKIRRHPVCAWNWGRKWPCPSLVRRKSLMAVSACQTTEQCLTEWSGGVIQVFPAPAQHDYTFWWDSVILWPLYVFCTKLDPIMLHYIVYGWENFMLTQDKPPQGLFHCIIHINMLKQQLSILDKTGSAFTVFAEGLLWKTVFGKKFLFVVSVQNSVSV